jgi:polyketide biosynthesis acyl carrier protein
MTKEEIFNIIQNHVIEVLPNISAGEIKTEYSLKDMGANSIDRMDIIVNVMETMKLKIPLLEFGKIKNIQELIDLLYEKKVG